MNNIQRLNTLLAGGIVDHVPHCLWYHHKNLEGSAAVSDHITFYRESGNAFIKIMNDYNFALDVKVRTPADWKVFSVGDGSEWYFVKLLEVVRGVVEAGRGQGLIYLTLFSPFNESSYAVGHDRVTADVKSRHPAVLDGLKKVEETLMKYVERYFEAGIDGIFYSCTGGRKDQFTHEEFETLIKPGDLAVLNWANTFKPNNMLHICSTNVELDYYQDYPCRVVNWNVHDDDLTLEEGRDFFKGKVLFGGMTGGWHAQGPLSHGTPEEAAQEAREVIARFGKQGLLLGPDCSLPNGSPLANIQAVAEVCRNS